MALKVIPSGFLNTLVHNNTIQEYLALKEICTDSELCRNAAFHILCCCEWEELSEVKITMMGSFLTRGLYTGEQPKEHI